MRKKVNNIYKVHLTSTKDWDQPGRLAGNQIGSFSVRLQPALGSAEKYTANQEWENPTLYFRIKERLHFSGG